MKLFNFFGKKEKKEETVNNSPELLMVKLFFNEEPVLDDEEINRCLKKRFDSIELPDTEKSKQDSNSKSRQYFFNEYMVNYDEGEIAAQGSIFISDAPGIQFEDLEKSFRQTWNWQEAESVVRQCKHELLLTDILSRSLDYKRRIEFYQKYVTSIVEAMNPTGIWFSNTEKLMRKDEFLNNFSANHYQDLNSFLNVRLFNLKEAKGEMVMDTLGLHALGLPDFEICFKEYDPTIIAGLLFNYGNYIFENGVVIENGNTIQGVEENQQWTCYFRESMLEPKRIVIAIEH